MIKRILLILLLVSLLIPSIVHAQPPDDNRYAVIVGISHSPHNNTHVNGDRTAGLMVSILRKHGWARKNIQVLKNRQATMQKTVGALNWLLSVENENSTVVVMFACHGTPVGVNLWDAGLFHGQIKEYLSKLKSQKQLVIITTCHSGGAIVPGFDGVTLEAPNRVVVTSCSEKGVDPCTAHYTRWAEAFLLEGIKKAKADFNNDGRVSIQEAKMYAKLGMMSDGYGEDFFL